MIQKKKKRKGNFLQNILLTFMLKILKIRDNVLTKEKLGAKYDNFKCDHLKLFTIRKIVLWF